MKAGGADHGLRRPFSHVARNVARSPVGALRRALPVGMHGTAPNRFAPPPHPPHGTDPGREASPQQAGEALLAGRASSAGAAMFPSNRQSFTHFFLPRPYQGVMHSGRLLSFLFMLLAVAIGLPGAAGAQTALGAPLQACIARVQPGDTARAMAEGSARFDCDTAQVSFGAGDYWVRIALPPHAGRAPLLLRSASLWQKAATLHILYADGAMSTYRMDDRAAARHLRLGAIFELPVPVRGHTATVALWRVEGAVNLRGIVADPRAIAPDELSRKDDLIALFYGGFLGLCLALLVYNLSLWTVLRHPFQISYCVMLVALGLYAFSSSGLLSWVLPDIGNVARIRTNYLLLATTAMAALGFARDYFGDHVFGRWLALATRTIWLMLGASALLLAVLAPRGMPLVSHLYTFSFLLVSALSIVILVVAWRRRSDHLWLFAIAWAAPIGFAALRIAGSVNLLPNTFLLDNSTVLAMAMEALVSGVAITCRIRTLSHERDAARAREMAARLLADSDPLTGLLNRRAFLREALGRDGSHLLALLDVDHFKAVNDTLGHDGGDEVLRRLAAALTAVSPAGALVARLGGEEFAVLAPDGATGLPDAILAAIRTTPMPFDLTVTASIGSGHGPLATEADWSRLYRAADQALMVAKKAGRDRARWTAAA